MVLKVLIIGLSFSRTAEAALCREKALRWFYRDPQGKLVTVVNNLLDQIVAKPAIS
jgi:hypothetical protein